MASLAEGRAAWDSVHVMLTKIGQSNAHFKHQQRDEPDLTFEEKYAIASDIFDRNKVRFLSRFGKYIGREDMACFEGIGGDYEVEFYMKEIESRVETEKKVVRNRRYEAMLVLLKDGDYFSQEEMKNRDPLLYEDMVGKFLTEKEIREKSEQNIDMSDCRFSTILMDFMKNKDENMHYLQQKVTEEGQMEESDSDSEDEVGSTCTSQGVEASTISDAEKNALKDEFLQLMKERFLEGEDVDFDYSTVDCNEEYDSLKLRQNDEEERYFDNEMPEDIQD